MNNRLLVYVRVKPSLDENRIVNIVDDKTLTFDPVPEATEDDVYMSHNGKQFRPPGTKIHKNSQYTFDGVFDDNSTNQSIFETVTKPMVDASIDGYNCSVFAYGATGSGKTYTMLGKQPDNPGVIYFTVKELYQKLAVISEQDPLPAELKICYFEVYNEKIRDLLVEPYNFFKCGNKRLRTTPERCRGRHNGAYRDAYNLPVCEGPGDTLVIPDLTFHSPEDPDQLIDLLERGNANRSQHPTDANADSSRSHALFQIVITRRTRRLNNNNNNNNNPSGPNYQLQTSKMSLIDLAGSERASVAYRPGINRGKNLLREGGNINKSLLALGNVINALADSRTSQKFINFRNSKLTRLLRDSLGGNCLTAMIATVCQQPGHYDDTQNTLAYASRAILIKTKASKNASNQAVLPRNYTIVLENQNKQITKLQFELQQHIRELEQLRPLKQENINLRQQIEQLIQENYSLRSQQVKPEFLERSNPNSTYIASDRSPLASKFLDKSSYTPILTKLFDKRDEIRMDIKDYEKKFKHNQLKLEFKKLDETRQNIIQSNIAKMNGNSTFTLASGMTATIPIPSEQSQEALRTQATYFEERRNQLLERADDNEEQISNVIQKMLNEFVARGFGSEAEFDEIISNFTTERNHHIELKEKEINEQHAYDLAQQAFDRLKTTESLLNDAAKVVRYTHAITKGRGLSEPLEAKLSGLLKRLDGKKSVIWKDDKFEMENNRGADDPELQISSVHDNFSLNFLTPFRNNNTLHSRRLSKNLVALSQYTPEQSNTTFDASQ